MWAKTLGRGKPMPVDPVPDPDGNVLLVAVDPSDPPVEYGALTIRGLTDEAREAAKRAGVVLHMSHFATCPNAADHRRPKGES